ncbi:hypothetical protein OG417_18250 [Actinoallomurus sp. NBC_01490]|jgi:hypothetical protein|uniref:hypothetical protein n=1 Tax=Actinoallomurus sp. NBC_01490 TaxID=2903557 RepID=UPI002E31DDC3|nr:hypothetical protein [Actinoallomurus sp. NBC_01490]
MTQPFDDEYGDRLRRALHAEAEAVTPSAEGLERIRAKINQRHERRFGVFSLSASWLRPLAAVAAAAVVCVVALSVTPGLANFVQTGHFSPDSGGHKGNSAATDGHSQGQPPPGGPSTPNPSSSPSPTSIHPSNSGKHVVTGTCPPGETTVTPTATPTAEGPVHVGPSARVTCQAPPGGGTTTPPSSGGATPPTESSPPTAPSSDQPTSDSAPTTAPNQSP